MKSSGFVRWLKTFLEMNGFDKLDRQKTKRISEQLRMIYEPKFNAVQSGKSLKRQLHKIHDFETQSMKSIKKCKRRVL